MRAGLAACIVALSLGAHAEPRLPTPLTACQHFGGRLPAVSARLCEGAELKESGARSVRGVPIFVRDVAAPEARLRVLVTGAIHGDELSSASLPFHWIRLAATEPLEARVVYLHHVDGLSLPAITALLDLHNKSGAKAYLEHGVSLNLVRDRHPDGLPGG